MSYMSATSEISMGIGDGRTSSRVLKPPGGGHSNIFAAPEAEVPRPRAKYNQQNSSNLNSCMNTVDPNEAVAKIQSPIQAPRESPIMNNNITNNNNHVKKPPAPAAPQQNGSVHQNGGGAAPPPPVQKVPTPVAEKASTPVTEKAFTPVVATTPVAAAPSPPSGGRVRQPPGGFSSGLW